MQWNGAGLLSLLLVVGLLLTLSVQFLHQASSSHCFLVHLLNAALKQGPDEILMQLNLFFEPKSKSTSFQVGLACFGLNQTQSFHLLVRSTGFYISPDPGSFDSWRVLFKL